MSEKHLVCHQALCECQFGDSPDKLLVSTQSKHYINDSKMSEKLIATDKEIGQPFEKNTFGQCKMQPLPSGGFKPCQPVITQWLEFYDQIMYEENSGFPLLEDSKAICAIAGSPCVSITDHGQIAEISQQNMDNADEETLAELNPLIDMKAEETEKIEFKV